MKQTNNILIVDDQLGPRESLKMILKPFYNVYTASDMDTALKTIQQNPIDLVTLDLELPGISGQELLKEIKELNSDLEIIIITGHENYNGLSEIIRYGIYDYIIKPFDVAEILSVVAKSLERRKLNLELKGLFQDILGEEPEREKEQKILPSTPLPKEKISPQDSLKFMPILKKKTEEVKELENNLFKEIKEGEEKIIKVERLSKLGMLMADFAHEINNLLGVILARVKLAQQRIPESSPGVKELNKDLEIVTAQTEKLAEFTRNISIFAKKNHKERREEKVSEIIDRTLTLLAPQIVKKGIKIEKEYDEDLPLLLTAPAELDQVFLNLIINAFQAMPEGGSLKIKVKGMRKGKNGFIKVSLSDTGPGIPYPRREKIFTPFFSDKLEEAGTGLGLYVSRKIMEKYGGSLVVENRKKGASFALNLPLV